ncbi:Dihydrolipoyl dehydrogenase [Lentibacillus sp. JNUCC-1]|uniref:dihydrolipoyl dehydrogenase family protein n=1 Tax=Lentibacillus sp. JNUCC-1 TaxID=2654513 RepID=UPI0012E93CC0|nr:FAD-dependent oxidoreductase [Lentibacillus sp. JNUCC-1]MUV37533.1 Dihydrolipoyl dehydrogenase [Lentibacillus sp. JNUCC-1]
MVVGELSETRDLIIIGGGPGGYNAAIRAAQLGMTVTLIEAEELGGACLNRGCIPSKIWTHAASVHAQIQKAGILGLDVETSAVNPKKLLKRKDAVIKQLKQGIETLLNRNQIEVIQGKAIFTGVNKVGVEHGHQYQTYTFNKAIIATGSTRRLPAGITPNIPRVLLADDLYRLDELPEHLVVYGDDYLALEMASAYAAYGSRVTLLLGNKGELLFDESLHRELTRQFKKQKIKMHKQAMITEVAEHDQGLNITWNQANEREQVIEATHLFVSGEVCPNTSELGLERIGVELTQEGFVKVNPMQQTSMDAIYAIGDITEGPPLAVKAIKEGKSAAEAAAGGHPDVNLTFVPTIARTIPSVVSVGTSEREAIAQHLEVRTGRFNLSGNGYSVLTDKSDGFIKIITDSQSGIILGVHMIGDGAAELSAVFVQLLEMAAKEEDMIYPMMIHPGVGESLQEAAEDLIGHAIHNMPALRMEVSSRQD